MTLYRAKANGNIVELPDDTAALLVPAIYEKIEDEPEPPKRKRESVRA